MRTALWVALFLATACETKPATQFTVGVLSQIRVPDDIQSVRIVASTGGNRGFCQTYPVVDGRARLPQSLALAPGGDENVPVTVTVMGFRRDKQFVDDTVPDTCGITHVSRSEDGQAQLLRRSKQTYVGERNVYIPMPLRYSCYGVDCPEDSSTCKGGACVSSNTDVTRLPDFSDGVFGGGQNTCFDPDRCLADAVGPTVINAAQCIYEVPDGANIGSAGMNVRVVYEGYRVEILDLDPDEGFTVDASNPRRFQLAPNLCTPPSPSAPKIINVNASRTCPSKNVYQPLCAKAAQTTTLRPARSALYILMDKGPTMSPYIGNSSDAQKFAAALSVALADPVFAVTLAAFRYVPDGPTACTAAYNTPMVVPGYPSNAKNGFAEMSFVSKPLGDLIGATTVDTALTTLLLNGVTNSAYNVTFPTTFGSTDTITYNKRAVLFVTNRKLANDVACTGDAATLVKSGKTGKGIDTYVLTVEDKSGTFPSSAAQEADANAFGVASGATILHGEKGNDQALTSIMNLIGDLSACVYDKPSNLTDTTKASVSLAIPPLPVPGGVPQSIPVPFNSSCGTASNVDGWNVIGSGPTKTQIQLCGTACDTARNSITANGGLTAIRNASTPSQAGQVLVTVAIAN